MISHSPQETENYGETLAALLRPGDTVWLYGDLGAGKTVFVRGLARGLGVTDRVTSPTYALNNVYRGKVTVAHYDAYRLEGFDDLLDAGWDEYDSGIRVVEWAQRVGEAGGICVMISSQAREPQLNCASSRSSETERELSLCFLP